MAVVSKFFRIVDRDGKLHPTHVECGYLVFKDNRRGTVLQLDTYGSDTRQDRGKQSQTLQLDEDQAKELVKILNNAFP